MNCEHQCSSNCRREGCRCNCPGEFHEVVEDITKGEWIEKEVAAKEEVMHLDNHNKTVLRSVLGKEFDQWEREAVREDNHTGRDDQ